MTIGITLPGFFLKYSFFSSQIFNSSMTMMSVKKSATAFSGVKKSAMITPKVLLGLFHHI